MALRVVRNPISLPLSAYDVHAPLDDFSSGYRGLIVKPGYIPRELTPDVIGLSAPLVKYMPGKDEPSIRLNIPVMSAAMQAISGTRMGIGLSRMGGIATINQSQTIEDEAEKVQTTKRHKGAFIEPEVVSPDVTLSYVAERMRTRGYSKFFVTGNGEQHGVLLGLITDNDFDESRHGSLCVHQRMRPRSQLEVAYDDEIGDDVRTANERVLESHHSALPILYRDERLRDIVFRKDIRSHRNYEDELIDERKRLMVAAAINTHDYTERVPALVDAGADVLVIDTSQGHTDFVKDASDFIRKHYDGLPFIGGNVVTREGFRFLVENCGVHAVKGGMGIGSICITPEQIGVASGQDQAIEEIADERDKYFAETGIYVPFIPDGGMHSVRDMLVALAFGGDIVMVGGFLAGTDETPTEVNYKMSPPKKPYWGEGSWRAMKWRELRGYNFRFDEGIERWVEYVGPLEKYLGTAMEQLKDGIRKAGCRTIEELHRLAEIRTISEKDMGTGD